MIENQEDEHFITENSQSLIKISRYIKTRFILLISLVIFMIETLCFIPSLSTTQYRLLEKKSAFVEQISLALLNHLDDNITQNLLQATDALEIDILDKKGSITKLKIRNSPPMIQRIINLDKFSKTDAVLAAFTTLLDFQGKPLQIISSLKKTHHKIFLTIQGHILHSTMITFTCYFVTIAFIAAITAIILIYLIVCKLLVQPMQHLCANMLNFMIEPDNPNYIIVPPFTKRQRCIAALQQNYIHQKHLANLGLSISKINHDLRNVLASAQLISHSLMRSKDPAVQRLTPKLLRTIDRAINYTRSILAYSKQQNKPLQKHRFLLYSLIKEVEESLSVFGKETVKICNFVPKNFEINADHEQLHRMISNLFRNAVQAMTLPENTWNSPIKKIIITAKHIDQFSIIHIRDTGPGLPQKAKEHLFIPFQGTGHKEGIGLGLAICFEITRAHGGTIHLIEDEKDGTHFEIRIPSYPSS
ncbi:MAG: ATP-binding protein [Candidatus Tokpelaia sp. JSC161]|jgi:signal transduction histidine kinase|nr:MAG: ATP-binding protein [Candidatus Tokpelaia sp. JSC161]